MCAIIGQVNKFNAEWLEPHTEKALQRGVDFTICETNNAKLYHTRLATNDSKDIYPIDIEGRKFAMNGIVGGSRYEKLKEKYKNRTEYTIDSAFLLLEWIDNQDWEQFDNPNYVFSFWLLDGDDLYIGNKDYPLYVRHGMGGYLWFSSFKDKKLKENKNTILKYNIKTKKLKEIYKFKDIIYDRD